MKLLCHNDISEVFLDGDNWFIKNNDSKRNKYISIKEEPMFPLACCLKWDFRPDDVDYLNNLSKT